MPPFFFSFLVMWSIFTNNFKGNLASSSKGTHIFAYDLFIGVNNVFPQVLPAKRGGLTSFKKEFPFIYNIYLKRGKIELRPSPSIKISYEFFKVKTDFSCSQFHI